LGHGLPGETLLKERLLDVLDLSVHPLLFGRGKPYFREGQNTTLRLIAAKAFSNGIVKLTYEPRYG
jgi:dihydrofolate reductase